MQPTNQFSDLIKIMQTLRKECPWDRKQTHQSIKDHLIEETYETIEAIDNEDSSNLKEELGDLLLHVIFHSRISAENNEFNINDVIYRLQTKLIDRHPHVFGNTNVENEEEVANNWEKLKIKEERDSLLDGIPNKLPALIQAKRLQEKAGSVGFDWKKSESGKKQLWDKLFEEFDEFKEAYEDNDDDQLKEEYGDLLFTVVNLGRFLDLQPEDCLRKTNNKFKQRFQFIEEQFAEQNIKLSQASLEKMEQYWQKAKENS